jgi:hypothetical protein
MKITPRTAAALTITASSLVLAVGAGASDSVVAADRDGADGGLIQCCTYGVEGPSTFVTLPTWSSASDEIERYYSGTPLPGTTAAIDPAVMPSREVQQVLEHFYLGTPLPSQATAPLGD